MAIGLKGFGVLAGGREIQVDELQQGFQIAGRGLPGQSLLELADIGRHRNDLAGQALLELHLAEGPHAPFAHHGGGGHGGQVGRVVGQGGAAVAEGGEEHFVILEFGGLQDHPDAVGQGPGHHIQLLDSLPVDDGRRRRDRRHQGGVGNGIDVGLDDQRIRGFQDGQQVTLNGHGDALLRGDVHHDDAVAAGDPIPGEAIHLPQRDAGEVAPHQGKLVGDAGDGLTGEEMADIFAGVAVRVGLVTLLKGGLQAPEEVTLGPLQFGGREPVAGHPLRLGHECLQTPVDAVVGHPGREQVDLAGADEATLP